MRVKLSLPVSLLAITWTMVPAAAEDLKFPAIPAHPQTAKELVPAGWEISGHAEGDLNKDGLADKTFVLLRKEKTADFDYQLIVVALTRGGGGYDVVLQNHSLFYREEEGSPRFLDVTPSITRGSLRLKTECGCVGADGSERFTFRWQQDHFNLIGYDYLYAHRGSTLDASINYLTGVAQLGSGHVTRADEADTSHRGGTIRFKPGKLLTFDETERGIAFLSKQLCPIGVKRFCS